MLSLTNEFHPSLEYNEWNNKIAYIQDALNQIINKQMEEIIITFIEIAEMQQIKEYGFKNFKKMQKSWDIYTSSLKNITLKTLLKVDD